jgi:Iap family predicted aminopeptidase
MRRPKIIAALIFLGVCFGLAAMLGWLLMIRMPGKSFRGTAPPLTTEEKALRVELAAHVQMLGGEIGERNLIRYPQLQSAAQYIENELTRFGWKVRRDEYDVHGQSCYNVEAELRGESPEIVLIGAHYDTVDGSPGANDNGSGVAAVLALSHRLSGSHNARTIRLVAFVNEEPQHFQTSQMGSFVYATRCRSRGDRIQAMMSLETIGYYSNEADSQSYPAPGLGLLYPRMGNFISFVGNVASRSLLRNIVGEFREHAQIASEGAALPPAVPGVSWSDQWSFWQNGYPGIMVTDTAPFRYPHYHAPSDTPDKLDYDSMTRVVVGLEHAIRRLANPPP